MAGLEDMVTKMHLVLEYNLKQVRLLVPSPGSKKKRKKRKKKKTYPNLLSSPQVHWCTSFSCVRAAVFLFSQAVLNGVWF